MLSGDQRSPAIGTKRKPKTIEGREEDMAKKAPAKKKAAAKKAPAKKAPAKKKAAAKAKK